MRTLAAALVAVLVLAACDTEDPASQIDAPERIELTSSAFEGGGTIPVEHTCEGTNVSPPLAWDDTGADVYALTMTDRDADGFVHWLVYGIPGSSTSLQEGELPGEAIEGATDLDGTGYGGPCPPEGDEPHDYVFTVYALDSAPEDPPAAGDDLDSVLDAISCCVEATGELVGNFGR